jgi:hypothetical protein
MSKIQERIRALLAKAIGTSFPEERESFAEKAFKLAIKYRKVVQFREMLLKAGIIANLVEEEMTSEIASEGEYHSTEDEEIQSQGYFERDPWMQWTTLDGRTLYVGQMETMHLINIRNYLKRVKKTNNYAYRNIVAEIQSRGPELPWKPVIRYRKRQKD